MAKIEFLGAVNTVTGSKFVISDDISSVLVDCGMFQGNKADAYQKNKAFDSNQPNPDYCILSHAHIDHAGMLPSLVKRGYAGKIYSTPATMNLCTHMLKDSVEVFTKELPIIRKIFKKNGIKEIVTPLYGVEDVEHCMNQFFPVDYEREFKLNSKMSFMFQDSCHILGSASVKLNVIDNNIKHRVFYTSDLGHNQSLLSEEPIVPQDIDYLIIESTYGNKKRILEDVYSKTAEYVNDAFKRGGRVIIPAFSVARMQTMILILHKLHILGLIPDITIYVDSPLGVKVTNLYEKYDNAIKQDTLKFFKNANVNPFNNSMIKYVTGMEESKLLSESGEPCVIISASGMCEGGHVREHLKTTVEDPKSTVMFVGYNAVETLGSRLQYNNGSVTIDGEAYRVRCKIESIGGLSAHADLQYLIGYIENVVASNAIKQIFLVHGEPESVKNIERILKLKGITNVVIPELGEKYKL